MNFVLVGLGGAVGAMLRYAVGYIPYKGVFPLLTLLVNLLGALLIGFVSGIADKKLSENVVLFLKTGVCGGFTTFSTFSLEAFKLFEAHHSFLALLYMLLSVGLCLAGVFVGTLLSEKVSI